MTMLKLPVTPLVHLERISRESGNEVYAKLENLNPTGSHQADKTSELGNRSSSLSTQASDWL